MDTLKNFDNYNISEYESLITYSECVINSLCEEATKDNPDLLCEFCKFRRICQDFQDLFVVSNTRSLKLKKKVGLI